MHDLAGSADDQIARADDLRFRRRFDEAVLAYRALLESRHQDRAHAGIAMSLLAMGRLAEAWPHYERRRFRRQLLARNLPIPEWRGEPLAGRRLLVWREQGLGDQIMMARFLPQLDAQVTYAGFKPLERLFEPLVDHYEIVENSVRISQFDLWVQSQSLPARLGVTEATLPRRPYLSAAPRRGGARIGVKWKGQPENPNDRFRTLPEDLAREILDLPGAISLEQEDLGTADLLETAEIVAGLDLVISIDTSVAHLAGAIGRPLWVLLAAETLDWQWPRHQVDLWYPSARGFLQPRPGDWRSVVDAVKARLEN